MARTLGLGTALGVDDDDSGATYTTITLVVEANPPPRTRARINAVVLSDTLAIDELGIEEQSDYTFTYYCEPNDTLHAVFRTLFASKNKILWQITFASTDIATFEGNIVSLVPGPATPDGLLSEVITVQRTGAITYT